ncbi:CLOCK-interacting pacemaker [Rhineura floridana]|uniref:CLOCK-interacting pacemaker n=1 Tax=Rhineura floridana TaxID=261503 RepID=UPI002AC81B7E|nr:CLOCK-interacting pacemaker [Rhineura floridana]XP_061453212.1 CLOCK-interacting pacemaker [Rhineura floridana]
MASSKGSPPTHASKLGKEKTNPARSLKADSPTSEGPAGQSEAPVQGASSRSRHPASEGEKDSGYSDESSEHLSTVDQTDTEDQPAYSLHQQAKLQRAPQKASRALAGSTFPGLTPVYIVKNVILKQPLGTSPSAQFLAWSCQHPFDSSQGSPAHVLFIQQPVASLKPLLPCQKSAAKETYLPLLSTYPKIAPHPGPGLQAKGVGGASKNKRFCLEEAWVTSSESAAPKDSREKPREEAPPPSSALPGPELLSQNTVSSSTGLDAAEGRMLSRASKRLGCSSAGKQRRFHNTVEILRKSGLLGITLRTKELIRQNTSTQREVAELREHTQLLCEAVQSNDSQTWARLQEAMDHSAAYWASKGASSYAHLGQQRRVADPVGSAPDAARESSPTSLSFSPDTSVYVALP